MNKFAEAVSDLGSIRVGKGSIREELEDGEPVPYSTGQSSYVKWKAIKRNTYLKNVDKLRGSTNTSLKSLKIQSHDMAVSNYHGYGVLEAKAFESPVRRLPSPESLVILRERGFIRDFSQGRKSFRSPESMTYDYAYIDENLSNLVTDSDAYRSGFEGGAQLPSIVIGSYIPAASGQDIFGVPLKSATTFDSGLFEPSKVLTKFLAVQEKLDLTIAHATLSKLVKDAVYGMMQSFSDAHIFEGQHDAVQLSVGSRFIEPIAKAVLARIAINTYDAPDFLLQLHKEVSNAAPIAVNEWTISALNGGLTLAVGAPVTATPVHRERAKVIRLKGGHREIKVE